MRKVNEEQPDTSELRQAQSRREAEEQSLASSAADEQETATHQRRAEKARFLRQKLDERAESEREIGAEETSESEADE